MKQDKYLGAGLVFGLVLLTATPFTSLFGWTSNPWLFSPDEKNVLLVQPRILAHVNGKAITVVDLMRKMDFAFYEQFSEYAESIAFRYQFYQMHWRQVLQDLIDQELMLADAEELKIELSRGEIRKEMERLFGPNVVANVQKARLQYDEALALIRADMLIQRLLYFKVHTPSLRYGTPKEVQIAYEEYQKTHQLPAEVTYRVISVRSTAAERAKEVSMSIHARLVAGEPIDEVVKEVQEQGQTQEKEQTQDDVNVVASAEEKRTEGELSEHYRTILMALPSNTYSEPLAQDSRKRGETLFRIFYLAQLRPAGAPPLSEVEETLKGERLAEANKRLTTEYLQGLRARYRVEEIQDYKKIPEEFEPFQMK